MFINWLAEPNWLGTLGNVFFLLVLRNVLGLVLGHYFLKTKKPVYNIPIPRSQLKSEAWANIKVTLADTLIIAGIIHFGLFIDSEVSWLSFILSYTLVYWIYEVWFYTAHRLMHHPKLYFIHRQHHLAKVTHPLSAMSFSVSEKLLLTMGYLGVPTLLSHLMNLNFDAILIYGLVSYFTSILGHSNREIYPPSYVSGWKGKVFGTPTFHSLHHSRMRGHYGLSTVLLDKWFGTTFKDYPEVQAQVTGGEPLTKLTQKGKPASIKKPFKPKQEAVSMQGRC